ncbi:MAG: transcriptional regulator, partial [SAR202 cluster bacterium Io17-Chloro-G3]
GERNSVAWNFEAKGVVAVEVGGEQAEMLTLLAIDAGAEDFEQEDDILEIRTEPEAFEDVRKAIEEAEANVVRAEVTKLPRATIFLDSKTAGQTLRLMDRLEDLDDVQKVYTNADFPEDALEEYQKTG